MFMFLKGWNNMGDYIYMAIISVEDITDNNPFWSYYIDSYVYSGYLMKFKCIGETHEWDICEAIADHFDIVGDFSFDVVRKGKRRFMKGCCVFLCERSDSGTYKIPLY